MTKNNTLLGLEMFDINIFDSYILHIPHSSVEIPLLNNFIPGKLNNEIIKLTDWATDIIFDIPNLTKIVTNFSRVFCDVERFSDDNLEPMSKYGRGFYYTKTDNGDDLRYNDEIYKKHIYENYYLSHHNLLNDLVNEKLLLFDTCTIIDCHSFSDIPFNSDTIKELNRPDICIGIDEYHTPNTLIQYFINYFKELGYTVEINNPYYGTMVNTDSYLKDKRVKSIMIEYNRKLYMDENIVNYDKVKKLNNELINLFK